MKILTDKEKEKKYKKLKKTYEQMKESLGLPDLNEEGAVVKSIHMLVDEGVKIQKIIDKTMYDIETNDLVKAQELTPIDKKTYMDFVDICSKKKADKLSEKVIEKFENEISNKLFLTNLRHSFLESYMSGDNLKITDKDNEEFEAFEDYVSNEFEKIMENSATKKDIMTNTYRRAYKNLSKCAEYVSGMKMKNKDFKALVDYECYKDGGYPAPNSPSKLWSMFDKFRHMYWLMSEYEFSQHKELSEEHGIDVILKEPKPVHHPWMDYDDENNEKI